MWHKKKPSHTEKNKPIFIVLTNSSSMLVWHFSRFILFMATRSCLGVQRAACTTAVAPLPGITATTEQWQSGLKQKRSHSTNSWKTAFKMSTTLWRSPICLALCSFIFTFMLPYFSPMWTIWNFGPRQWHKMTLSTGFLIFCCCCFFLPKVMACLLGSLQILSCWSSEVVHTKKLWHTTYCLPTVSGR